MNATITCLGAQCPERFSLCCHARSKAKGRGFVCSKCGKKFKGGECVSGRGMNKEEAVAWAKNEIREYEKFIKILKKMI